MEPGESLEEVAARELFENIRVYKFHTYNLLIFLKRKKLALREDGVSRFFLRNRIKSKLPRNVSYILGKRHVLQISSW